MSNRYTQPSGFTLGFYRWIYDPLRGPYFRRLVDSLALTGSERVLDFGSGAGSEAIYLARALRRGGRLTCLDVSPGWLAEARRRLRLLDNVDFLLGEATDVVLPNASFDLAFAHFVLHDVDRESLPAVLESVARSLRPGGRFVVVEPTSHHGLSLEELGGMMAAAGFAQESSGIVSGLAGKALQAAFRRE